MNKVLKRSVSRLLFMVDYMTRPAPVKRSEQEQRKLARETRGMSLYDYRGCSSSLKVWREIRRLNLEIERRDIRSSSIHQDNLLTELGTLKAPCLRVEEGGRVFWLEDQEDIIHFLRHRLDTAPETPLGARRFGRGAGL